MLQLILFPFLFPGCVGGPKGSPGQPGRPGPGGKLESTSSLPLCVFISLSLLPTFFLCPLHFSLALDVATFCHLGTPAQTVVASVGSRLLLIGVENVCGNRHLVDPKLKEKIPVTQDSAPAVALTLVGSQNAETEVPL